MQDLDKLWHQVRSMIVLILLLTAVAICLTIVMMNKKITSETQTISQSTSKTLSI